MLKISTLLSVFVLFIGQMFGPMAFAENTQTTSQPQTFAVSGMHCGACAQMIEKKVCKLEGVETCSVEVGKITLTSKTPMTSEQIQTALSAVGEYKLVKEGEVASAHGHKCDSKNCKKNKKHQ